MSQPGHRSALAAIRDDSPVSDAAGQPDLVVQRVLRGFWERRSPRPPRTRVVTLGHVGGWCERCCLAACSLSWVLTL